MPTIHDIKDFHLDSDASIALLETLEISHSLWSQPLRYVTNHADGLNANVNGQAVYFEFAPVLVKRGNTSDDLDQSLSITVGDLGEVIPPLIDILRNAASDERPQVTYRAYAFDTTAMQLVRSEPIDIVRGLEVVSMNRDYQATTFDAKAPSKNSVKTGRTYNMRDYPDLKGFI